MNTFGRTFRVTTFGESHGPAIGVVIDGCPPGIRLEAKDIQPLLDRRRPGKSPLESPRQEMDRVEILSGIFEGITTGTPIAMIVFSHDARPDEYSALRNVFRPGHADYTFHHKYGIRDHRGGGRSSGRETVARVAAGALAMKCLLQAGITIQGRILHIHGSTTPEGMEQEIRRAQEKGDSVGGVIELSVTGCPAGLGDPVFGKLDACIAGALMGIGGVKGVEIGDGFPISHFYGSEANDGMNRNGFLSNHSGGILGGISTGNTIVVRCAVKPTPSIALPQKTITTSSEETVITLKGRHDPCIVPRVLPVAEAMIALVLFDALLEQMKYRQYISETEEKTSKK
ncbi:MAG: chorismate synthase [Methanomicrobiales archaeon]|nr:chorismate synthase [Methanomicrobiales archaeon]